MRPISATALFVCLAACHPVRASADAAPALDAGAVASDGGDGSPVLAPDASVVASPAKAADAPVGEQKHVHVKISGSLEGSMTGVLPREVALPLTQVVARVLVWWVDLRKGLNKGDEIDVVYSLPPGKEPMVHAIAWVSSQGKGKHLAYLFEAPGAPFARYFDADGKEIELRLVDGPIDTYDQVTSLLRDGRRHKGVDFRTPSGTPVKMPFDGTLVRKNWSFRGNGNCLEFQDPASGRSAIFLHLSPLPKDLEPGKHFKKGEVVAKSDNSGHSTAPHLHYQLVSPSGAILDPFEVHKTYRAELKIEAKGAFDGEVRRLNLLLEQK